MSSLTFYDAEVCPYAQRTRILLSIKNVEHDVVLLDIEDKPDWFMSKTPAGRVPVIEHDGRTLWESSVINEYIDAIFPGPRLMPDDEYQRALIRIENRHFDQVFLPMFYKLLFEQDANQQDIERDKVVGGLRFLEQRLEALQGDGGSYWLGRSLTMADINMFSFFERFEVFDYYRQLKIPSDCIRLVKWFETLMGHSEFRGSMHDLEYWIPRYANYASGAGQGLSAQAFRAGAAN